MEGGDGAFNDTGSTVNNSNVTVQAVEDYDYSERPETYIVPVLFAFIFFVGTVGNGSLVMIFFRHKHMINVPNIYILSLALGDLLVLLSCIPFTSTVYTVSSWPFGVTICKVAETTKDISIGVTVFTLTALSADRFFAIVDPMRKLHASVGGRRATKFTVTVAVVIWCLAVACAMPAAVYSYIRPFGENNVTLFKACYPYPEELGPTYPRVVVLVRFLVYYAVPLSTIACFYVMMARHLINSTKNMPGEVQGQLRQVRARKKVAKTVLAFVLVFAVCFLPNHVFMLWFYNNPRSQEEYNTFWHVLRIVGFCLCYSNSCINPIALYLVSGTFRKHFDRQLFWWFVKPQGAAAESKNGYIRRKNGTREKDRGGTINESTTMGNVPLSTFAKRTVETNITTTTTVLVCGLHEANTII
ncbi:neuropeptide CCHamide-1 receptor-like [Sipha flava]|uniref:Neuropeptide CCHamide-1 receptor-like n=1 Tax=Sipha flava TaxID=143950 RepID=A0A2S2QN14_9HEMI|nr:neuropeptide CCHamide-1 receptor-like [Sipha flava]XP_025409815.1 neuropeptide CCHamide-1 receptor-like [Sipha flava]XP_025409816.1 neuropeptide CCHamide-1 receptor-like [Sipha flava]XP_025409817.1 neuropeptide CCHamide-1 receptor-like [Sipha flava]XP_025409818.1 neuropeptide CCHamide-1 receptor-like [Sipha flava]XP_025409819.1 neuropeptide CCHamide-1 receptor-like [Sipha flava]